MNSTGLPLWFGKEAVPETRAASLELLSAWARLLCEPEPVNPPQEGSEAWLVSWVYQQASALQAATNVIVMGWDDGIGILVGFQETRMGWLNATLAGAVARLSRFLISKEKDAQI